MIGLARYAMTSPLSSVGPVHGTQESNEVKPPRSEGAKYRSSGSQGMSGRWRQLRSTQEGDLRWNALFLYHGPWSAWSTSSKQVLVAPATSPA